jgi:rubrerythrin
MMNTENYELAALLAKNAADEQEAIQGYYELLPKIMGAEDIATIKEIISDEKNHAMKLAQMALKYDGNIVMAND